MLAGGGGSQHVFLATNEASYYSFVLVLSEGKKFKALVSMFLDHWLDAVSTRGLDVDGEFVHETQFLRGQPRKLIGAMKEFVFQIAQSATEGDGVEERETLH